MGHRYSFFAIALSTAAIAAGQTKPVQIIDPVFQVRAYSWTIPANWTFNGMVMEGTSCVQTPFPIFRITAPDGVSQLKVLPRFDWTWQTGGIGKAQPAADCLPLNTQLSAADFLKIMVRVLGVTYVRDLETPDLAQYRETLNRQSANSPIKVSGDQARFLVRYSVNNIAVEEYIHATTRCTENTRRFGVNQVQMTLFACSATLTRGRARQGQLEAMTPRFQSIGKSVVVNPQWNEKWEAALMARAQENMRRGTEAIVRKGEATRAMQQRQHEQFLAVMQRGTDMSMQRTQDSMDARSRMAGDWADYALDLQKRRDPGTGNIVKTSSQYSYTWLNESGQPYNTNDPNDNPNGRLKGNWTLQQNVR